MNDPFEPRDVELWYVEAYDAYTGRIQEQYGPVTYEEAHIAEAGMRLDYGDKYAIRQVNVVDMANKSRQCNAQHVE